MKEAARIRAASLFAIYPADRPVSDWIYVALKLPVFLKAEAF